MPAPRATVRASPNARGIIPDQKPKIPVKRKNPFIFQGYSYNYIKTKSDFLDTIKSLESLCIARTSTTCKGCDLLGDF